jgi:hypothetical protein
MGAVSRARPTQNPERELSVCLAVLSALGQARSNVQRSADALFAELGPKVGAVDDSFERKYGWAKTESPDLETAIRSFKEKVEPSSAGAT